MRACAALLLCALVAAAAVVGAPAPKPRGSRVWLDGWDKPVGPLANCHFDREGDKLTITIVSSVKGGVTIASLLRDVEGDFVVQVNRDWAPNGADRFYNLVKNGFYDGQRFFRVVPGFVAQWGIPADPTIAPAWRSATIRDDPHKEKNDLGTVTFATAGPHQRTTQVFINLKLNKELDGRGFTPFGLVVDEAVVAAGLAAALAMGVVGTFPPALRCLSRPVASSLRAA